MPNNVQRLGIAPLALSSAKLLNCAALMKRSPYSERPVTYGTDAEAMRDELDYERRPAKANDSRIGQVDWSIGVGPPIEGACLSLVPSKAQPAQP